MEYRNVCRVATVMISKKTWKSFVSRARSKCWGIVLITQSSRESWEVTWYAPAKDPLWSHDPCFKYSWTFQKGLRQLTERCKTMKKSSSDSRRENEKKNVEKKCEKKCLQNNIPGEKCLFAYVEKGKIHWKSIGFWLVGS